LDCCGFRCDNIMLCSSTDGCDNLIDFEAPTPPAFGPSVGEKMLELTERENALSESRNGSSKNDAPDPFDMRKCVQ